jgi:hypothetical protein
MMLGLPISLIVPLVAGYCLAGALPTTPASARHSPLLRACLAVGWGTGMASCLFFAWLVLLGRPGQAFCAVDIALFVGLAATAVARRPHGRAAGHEGRREEFPKVVAPILGAALGAALALGIAAFVSLSLRNPHGQWDAIAIWNLRARCLYRGGEAWAESFHPGLIASHLDYPLLVPAAVARCWVYHGRETTVAPALLAGAFTLATVGLLVSALDALRGRNQGILGGLVLLASPRLFEWGSHQVADVPLAYFFLATAVALSMGDRDPATAASPSWTALAGMMAGFAAWTKNEGLLFLAALLAARLALVVPALGWRAFRAEAAGFALGLAPVLAVVVYFKVRFSPPNDLLTDQGLNSLAARLTDPARYAAIGRAIAVDVFGLGSGAIAWLAAYRLLLGRKPRRAGVPGGAFAILVLALMLAGYVLVYVVTPLHLPWHLQWSLPRLILQLWPLAVFAFFLNTATPEETWSGTR